MTMNSSLTPLDTENVDTYLVDQVLQQTGQARLDDEIPVSEQLLAMKAELLRLSESVALLAEGATMITRQVPKVIITAADEQIQLRPVLTLAATVALSFSITRIILS